MDGIFKMAPNIVKLVYSIHFTVHDNVLPGIFCIMTHKNQASYDPFFQVVKNGLPEGRCDGPDHLSLDF